MIRSKSTTKAFICTNCGFRLEINPFYIRLTKIIACPVCQSKDDWKLLSKATKQEIENELWKKLLIASNNLKFKNGKFKVAKNYKKFYDWVEYEVKFERPDLYNYLKKMCWEVELTEK